MSFENVLSIAPVVGVVIGMGIYTAAQRKKSAVLGEKILMELRAHESLTLPELVTKMGMSDGFINRGKLVNVLNPMVIAGQVTRAEPPGTTVKNRLSVVRYRLAEGRPSASISDS
jgi:hypothetical protein